MKLGFGKGLVTGVAGVAALLAIIAADNGTGLGAVFNLGKTNKVNATSALSGTTSGTMLKISNFGTGGTLNLRVGKGRAPFSVSSSTQVAKLNASLLDGLSANSFLQGDGAQRTAQVTLTEGESKPLLSLFPFGAFTADCAPGPTAQLQYQDGSDPVAVWDDTLTTSGSASLQVQSVNPGASIFLTAFTPIEFQLTIQDAATTSLNKDIASIRIVEQAIGDACDFGIVANGGS